MDLTALVASALAPLFMSLGFIIWGNYWSGSAFSLNMFKCTLGGALFFFISIVHNSPGLQLLQTKPQSSLQPLMMSSLLGIVIGDNAWLMGLKILGARRVILVDSLKPILSATSAAIFLQEPFTIFTGMGSFLSAAGIAVVCSERVESQTSPSEDSPSRGFFRSHSAGYAFAFLNVLLDVFGSILTRQSGEGLTTWEINGVRFGFAAVVLWTASLVLREVTIYNENRGEHYKHYGTEVAETRGDNWFDLPVLPSIAWVKISAGVMLVTFICPALSNFGLFYLRLGLALTLGSLGPVYALCIDCCIGKPVSLRAIVGSCACFAGVALLYLG